MVRVRAVMLASLLTVSGCATVIRGTKDKFVVITEPEGASVTTDLLTPGSKKAVRKYERAMERLKAGAEAPPEPELVYFACEPTPCDFKVSRKSEFSVTIEKEGYHSATVEVTSGFGKKGPTTSAGGAAVSATGAYVVSYSVFSTVSTMFSTLLTLGASTSNTGVSAAATGVSLGFGAVLIGVDLVSGAMLDLRPNPLVLILVPIDQPRPDDQTEIIVDEEQVKALIVKYRKEKS